jgi:hypothetical protein|tara:strand:+ start:4476 stop:4616 length:141 start_codon:yes stop_codon:yes gene_type:complete
MTDNILTFPQTSELDKQFLEMEKQRKDIAEQKELIARMHREKNAAR